MNLFKEIWQNIDEIGSKTVMAQEENLIFLVMTRILIMI